MNPYRTFNCGELRKTHIGQRIRLAGWVDTIRDHGGVAFVDLRDHYGTTQAVINDDSLLKNICRETVISVGGTLRERSAETVNLKIGTGEVELKADAVEILGPSLNKLPFEISESHLSNDAVRLKYRFLDLRNPVMQKNIIMRSEIIKAIRANMEGQGFVEIQTPILTSSSPEGARDYLVPSRKHHGKFYALPQAPQQFKQLLMVSGFDKYFQIAPCFRDEDSRADRTPGEFYQLDFEMAFATQEEVFAVAEKVLYETFIKFTDKYVSPPPFRRLPYAEAMAAYGTDKPDLRNPLRIVDFTDFFRGVDFAPFKNKPVRGIVAHDCADRTRSFFEGMLEYATGIGMKGLGYISANEGMILKGPIVRFLSEEKQKTLTETLDLKINDTLFFISDSPKQADNLAGQIRSELGRRLGIIDETRFEFCFVTDFPMYELNEETGAVQFSHNPFSMPQGGLEALSAEDPLTILAYQYDVVCNGVELTSGAVRNCRPDVMEKAFAIAGYTKNELETKFPALWNAFKYGAPPHAGMAPGVDRIVMLLTEQKNLREGIAFPMNASAQDVLMGAPGEVSETQLREAHIRVRSLPKAD